MNRQSKIKCSKLLQNHLINKNANQLKEYEQSKQHNVNITLKQIKNQLSSVTLPPSYKHQSDTRTQKQINLSDQIVRCLSQINLKRIRKSWSYYQPEAPIHKYFFLCLTGMPPFPNQFEDIQVPGQKYIHTIKGFTSGFSFQQFQSVFDRTCFQNEADIIDEIVEGKCGSGTCRLVVVFHSFGTFVFNAYLRKYSYKKRLYGLIDIAGVSVTVYQRMILPVNFSSQIPAQFFNPPLTQSNFINLNKKYQQLSHGRKYKHLTNPYHQVIFLKLMRQQFIKHMYTQIRKYPEVLKLFFIGRRDNILLESNMSEKIIHYLYVNRLPKQMQQKYTKSYHHFYQKIGRSTQNFTQKEKIQSIQQRFVISFPNGKHSVHMQKSLVEDINISIRQYIQVIDKADFI